MKFDYKVISPRDPNTGQPTGKRVQQPIVITKPTGASTPQFLQAMSSNEVLKSVLIEFTSSVPMAETTVYYTVRLTNVSMSSIHQFSEDGKTHDEITLYFQLM